MQQGMRTVAIPQTRVIKPALLKESEHYLKLRHDLFNAMPDFRAMARDFMRIKIRQMTQQDADPEHLYCHYFGESARVTSPYAFSGWEHCHTPLRTMTLTELLLNNFDALAEDTDPDTLNATWGIYTDNNSVSYGVHNEFKILPSALRARLWRDDFYTHVTEHLTHFWEKHTDDWRTLARAEFVWQARKARQAGLLSEEAYVMAMQGGASNVPLYDVVTLAQLQAQATPAENITASRLDINGYAASDIVRITGHDGLIVLYLAGAEQPFLTFRSNNEMRKIIVQKSRDHHWRREFASHFSLYDREDGFFYTGVDSALEKLASGTWSVTGKGINYHDEAIAGDIFSEMTKNTRARSLQDADTAITSNSEINLTRTLIFLRTANGLFAPLALLAGPVGITLGNSAWISQLGITAYQTMSSDTGAERRESLASLGTEAITALLFGTLLNPAISRSVAAEESHFLLPPQRINGKTGYPLSPTKPPKLPRLTESALAENEEASSFSSSGSDSDNETATETEFSSPGSTGSTSSDFSDEENHLLSEFRKTLRKDVSGEPVSFPEARDIITTHYSEKQREEICILEEGDDDALQTLVDKYNNEGERLYKKLPFRDFFALENFQAEGYTRINRDFPGSELSGETTEAWRALLRLSAMQSRAPVKPRTLWRGTVKDDVFVASLKKGDTFTSKHFMSASKDRVIAQHFLGSTLEPGEKNVLYKIEYNSPLLGPQLDKLFSTDGEREIVILPDMKFRIENVKKITPDEIQVSLKPIPFSIDSWYQRAQQVYAINQPPFLQKNTENLIQGMAAFSSEENSVTAASQQIVIASTSKQIVPAPSYSQGSS